MQRAHLEHPRGHALSLGLLVLHHLRVQPGVHVVLVRVLGGDGPQVRPHLTRRRLLVLFTHVVAQWAVSYVYG